MLKKWSNSLLASGKGAPPKRCTHHQAFNFGMITSLASLLTYLLLIPIISPNLPALLLFLILLPMKCSQLMCSLCMHASMWEMLMPPRMGVILTLPFQRNVTFPILLGSPNSHFLIVHARGYSICYRDPALFDKLLYNNYIYPLGRAEK